MKCGKCQKPLLDSDAFCSKCGTPRLTDHMCIHCRKPVGDKQKLCPNCGKPTELICPCGASLNPNSKFCGTCGKEIGQLPIQVLYCGKCRTPIERDQHYCIECGTPVTAASLLTVPTPCSEGPAPAEESDVKDGTASEAQPCKDTAAQPPESKFSTPNDSASEKENDETCHNGTNSEHPSPVTSGGEQTVTTPIAETGQSQESEFTTEETSKENGKATGCTGSPGNSVADVSGTSEGGEPDKDTTDKEGESQGANSRHSQPTGQTDSASGYKDGAKLPGKPPSPEIVKPNENQTTTETPCEDIVVDGNTKKPSDSPETFMQGTEALPQARSAADSESSSSDTCTPLQLADASLEMPNTAASSHTGNLASPKDGDINLVATGLSVDGTVNDKKEDSTSDESESGEEQDADDDGGSSRSRDSSQHKSAKEKKRRQKKLNSRQKKKLRKREAQQHSEITKHTAMVRFHVVISKKFKKLEANNHHVFLCWKPDVKKPSPDHLVEMHFKERMEDCGNLFECSMDLNKLPKHPKALYKYCIEVDGKFDFETVYHQKDHNMREVPRIPNQQTLHKGIWDVYDWVAYPDGMHGTKDVFCRIFGLGTSSSDIFIRDMKSACSLFLPPPDTIMDTLCDHVDKQGQTAEDFLRLIKVITLKSSFTAASTRDMEKFIGECVEQFLLESVIKRTKMAVYSDKRTVVVAMFLLLLAESVKVNLGPDDRNTVFRALLIKPDMEKRTCPDVTHLSNHYPDLMNDKQTLQRKIMSLFLKDKQDVDPAWICAIPLLHLLSDECRAFNAPPLSENHRTDSWWGITQLKEKVEGFKFATQRSDWKHPVRDVFGWLSKAFQADPLMLRSFVATMNLKQLLSLLPDAELPAEIAMASLFFHLNANADGCRHTHWMIIGDILRKMATVFKTTVASGGQVSAQETDHYRLIAVVGIDLLEEVTKSHRCHEHLIHSVVLLQLSILNVLTRQQCLSCLARSAATPTEMILQNTLHFIKCWVSEFQYIQIEWKEFRWMMEESFQASKELPMADMRTQVEDVLSKCVKKYINMVKKI